MPHADEPVFLAEAAPSDFMYPTRGGVSRWDGSGELRIAGATLMTEARETNVLQSLCPAKVVMRVRADRSGIYSCRYAFVVYDHMGRCVLDILSPEHAFEAHVDQVFQVEMVLNPLQLGPGEYTMSLSIHKYEMLERFNVTPRFDLVNRSIAFSVQLFETIRAIEAQFYHSAEWQFSELSSTKIVDSSS